MSGADVFSSGATNARRIAASHGLVRIYSLSPRKPSRTGAAPGEIVVLPTPRGTISPKVTVRQPTEPDRSRQQMLAGREGFPSQSACLRSGRWLSVSEVSDADKRKVRRTPSATSSERTGSVGAGGGAGNWGSDVSVPRSASVRHADSDNARSMTAGVPPRDAIQGQLDRGDGPDTRSRRRHHLTTAISVCAKSLPVHSSSSFRTAASA